jgi:hypothetical protein
VLVSADASAAVASLSFLSPISKIFLLKNSIYFFGFHSQCLQ